MESKLNRFQGGEEGGMNWEIGSDICIVYIHIYYIYIYTHMYTTTMYKIDS